FHRRRYHDGRRPNHGRVLWRVDGPAEGARPPLPHPVYFLVMREVCTTVALLRASALVCAQRFRSDVLLVNVVATVVDGKGRTIPNLTADDFVIEEDGQPQAIKILMPSAD